MNSEMNRGAWLGAMLALVGLAGGCALSTGDETELEAEGELGSVQEKLAPCPSNATCVTKTVGKITVRYYVCNWSGSSSRNRTSCNVDADFVLVGGGAEIQDNGSPGALLTGSFPSESGWQAESKDHTQVFKHRTRAYAVGLRVAGMSAADLQPSVTIRASANGPLAHPTATVFAPTGDLVLSGGGQTQYVGAGQLLTQSVPVTGAGAHPRRTTNTRTRATSPRTCSASKRIRSVRCVRWSRT